MARTDKRNKRKRERTRRSGAWNAKRQVMGQFDFIGDFEKLCKLEVERHDSLLNIIELPEDVVALGLDEEGILNYFGYGQYILLNWVAHSADEYYSKVQQSDGGYTQALQDKAGGFHSIVFIKTRKGDRWALAGINIAVLCHELGHVDDMGKGINFRSGNPVDLVSAELYAHTFACTELMRQRFRGPLAYYLTDMLSQLKRSDAKLVRLAAIAFLESSEYEGFRVWNKTYVQAFAS